MGNDEKEMLMILVGYWVKCSFASVVVRGGPEKVL